MNWRGGFFHVWLLFALTCWLPGAAQAAYQSGNQLLDQCSRTDSAFYKGVCSGFILGVFESINVHGYKCNVANGVTNGQIVDIVVEYLRRNPEQRHEAAVLIASLAIIETFDCKQQKRK